MSKGFIFSMEAALSLLLMGMMLLSLQAPHPTTLKELLIIQQENDLLKIWSAKGFDEASAKQDIFTAFGNEAELTIGENFGAMKENNAKWNDAISSEAVLLDGTLREVKARILVRLG